MANTYHQIYLHCIFAVKHRHAILSEENLPLICGVIGNLINETGCKILIVNGTSDHIHCLLGLKPIVSISDLMKTVKSKSSKFINDRDLMPNRFEWQEGYGAFSCSESDVKRVYQYVLMQKEHHKALSFSDEYLNFLKTYNVSYDERYLFEDLIGA